MRRLTVAVLALAFPVVFAGCGNDDNHNLVNPTVDFVGNWTLRTVNGAPLPFTFSDGSVLTSDVLTLNADGSYTDNGQFSNGALSVEAGFYSPFTGSISFVVTNTGQTYSGSVSGTFLTEVFTNFTLVYQKQ